MKKKKNRPFIKLKCKKEQFTINTQDLNDFL